MTAELPQLFSFRRCPYAMRARLALLVAGCDVVIDEVRLSDKPAALRMVSAKATVPVLVLPDGGVIDESLDIMQWALAQADPENWLDTVDEALIAANDGEFKYHLDRTKYPDRHGSNPQLHRVAASAFLQTLEVRLAAHAMLCGTRPGLTDAAIMPFVRQFAATDRDWFAAQPLLQLRAWLVMWETSALFDAAMLRIAPGQRQRFNRDVVGLSGQAAARG